MLKNIPSILSPELLKILMEMGHGDEICIGDGNFPSANYGQRLVRLDGHGVPEILDAVVSLFPLDTFVEHNAFLMETGGADNGKDPAIWKEFEDILRKREENFSEFGFIERFAFYERAKKAYAVIASGETAIYANIILKKGVVFQ